MRKIPHIKRPSAHANRVGFVNSITSGALLCGLMSVLFSATGNFYMGALLILGAMILDGIDGSGEISEEEYLDWKRGFTGR